MKTTFLTLITVILFCGIVSQSDAYNFHWEIDETPEGQESATVVEPIQVNILDEQVEIASHSASLRLLQVYSVHLGPEWESGYAHRLFLTFESIPQQKNPLYENSTLQPSIWKLSNSHIQNDIEIEYSGDTKIVTIATDAFTYATPLLAEIEGVRGRYFSKRLHRAVVRYVTDNGADRNAIKRILQERYAVSIDVPDYIELTKYTTGEHAGRFSTFKDEELMALVSMFEEFPQGMLKTPGLKYLVRRLDGTPHPLYLATAVAWPSAGYIEFMEAAFIGGSPDYMHRLILHEKAHFLWAHLFDKQLKQDWIELGGWYENADDEDGWSTTKQTEFVSAYAHTKNPDEDMAESISFYIVRPDKLRSRAPAKYEFIRNRIMHGTRYISQIREDLTFEVYNLYPDYVYPGRIVRVDIQVDGEPEEDKMITAKIEIHRKSELDSARGIFIRLFSEKGTFFDVWLSPINAQGQRISAGHVFRGSTTLTRYAANGYWGPDSVTLSDVSGNQRHESAQTDFGWKLYINNPLADCQLPAYVEESMRLSLSQGIEEDRAFHIITARWQIVEDIGIRNVSVHINDESRGTYSRNAKSWRNPQVAAGGGRGYNHETGEVTAELVIPDYYQNGNYLVHYISMIDFAGNRSGVYFSNFDGGLWETDIKLDELPASIYVPTINPDNAPVVLDLNNIMIKAEPTRPEDPNGETIVDITFRVKDNISGYWKADLRLRDPLGNIHQFTHFHPEHYKIYFHGDSKVYETYLKQIILPVGSIPGTWSLAEMVVFDKAHNILRADFTEIVRFKVDDNAVYSQSDVNEDGVINILDLVLVAQAFEDFNEKADVNGDGTVNILDLVEVASQLGEEAAAAPSVHSPTADQIQGWLSEAMQANDGSNNFRRGIQVLQSLLLKLRPETTALLPNYPNPFNPETWIPYHLANTSNVQIIIYDTKGRVVRTLALGHQTAGYYTDRNRAAYWNGRNGLEESVASGVYFYQLKTDATSYLRKMVILK